MARPIILPWATNSKRNNNNNSAKKNIAHTMDKIWCACDPLTYKLKITSAKKVLIYSLEYNSDCYCNCNSQQWHISWLLSTGVIYDDHIMCIYGTLYCSLSLSLYRLPQQSVLCVSISMYEHDSQIKWVHKIKMLIKFVWQNRCSPSAECVYSYDGPMPPYPILLFSHTRPLILCVFVSVHVYE